MNYLPYLIVAVICGVIGMAIGDLANKKNGVLGLALGALLGPLGILIVAVLPAGAAGSQEGKSNVVPLIIIAAVIAVLLIAAVMVLPKMVVG